MSHNRWNIDEIENLGRLATPSLSPELRDRTLTQCTQVAHKQLRRRRQRGWALISTFVGICLLHWVTISALNTNNMALPPHNKSGQTAARFAMTPDEYHKLLQQQTVWLAFAEADINAAPHK